MKQKFLTLFSAHLHLPLLRQFPTHPHLHFAIFQTNQSINQYGLIRNGRVWQTAVLRLRFVDEHFDGAIKIGADQHITAALLVLLYQRIRLIVRQLEIIIMKLNNEMEINLK